MREHVTFLVVGIFICNVVGTKQKKQNDVLLLAAALITVVWNYHCRPDNIQLTELIEAIGGLIEAIGGAIGWEINHLLRWLIDHEISIDWC